MGYYPFSMLGRDPEMVSWLAEPGTRVRARGPDARPSVRALQGSCECSSMRDKVLVCARHGPSSLVS